MADMTTIPVADSDHPDNGADHAHEDAELDQYERSDLDLSDLPDVAPDESEPPT